MARNDLDEPSIRPDGLQIDDDRAGQERFWRVERLAHLGFAVAVVLAVLGLFGAGGPLSAGTVSAATGAIRYERIARWQTGAEVDVVFAHDRDAHVLELTSPDWDTLTLDPVQPAPTRATAIPDGVRLEFAGDGAASAAALELTASSPGLKQLTFAIDGAPPLEATTLVLP